MRLIFIFFFLQVLQISIHLSAQVSVIRYLADQTQTTDSIWNLLSKQNEDSISMYPSFTDRAESFSMAILQKKFNDEILPQASLAAQSQANMLKELSDFPVASASEVMNELSEQKTNLLNVSALDHFLGKEEVLQEAMNTFSRLKQGRERLNDLMQKSDSAKKFKPPGFTFISLGTFRPIGTDLSLAVYPSAGFVWRSGFGLQMGFVRRISVARESGRIAGYRSAASYQLNPGFSLSMEIEILKTTFMGIKSKRSHLVSSLKKTIPVYRSLYSFVQFSFDWGRQVSGDGYPERFGYQAGVQLQLKPEKRKH